ncbi:hypothetical protein [Puniceicoccus vermicola]|uniref:Uncharacterized protein n=1 Tax=Puniceicoccus vermicola TaxID=388746 RepID=A0A7X1E6E6_9BACT|nr:hypothetical protein [Puniceicoccus vermicola]MBC2604023.1 hypothetical protein [Puniceicoccus vermicola]
MVRTSKNKEATLTGVLIGAAAAAILGVILGFTYEVRRTPDLVRSRSALESEKDPLTERFRFGSTSSSGGWQQLMQSAQNSLTSNQSIRLREGELNQIASQYLNFTLGKQQSQQNETPSYALLPDTPNFAISDSDLQMIIPFEVLFFGMEAEGFLIAQGDFTNGGEGPHYSVGEAWINSARIPPFLAKLFVSRLATSVQEMSSDSPIVTAWSQIKSISIENDTMTLQPR